MDFDSTPDPVDALDQEPDPLDEILDSEDAPEDPFVASEASDDAPNSGAESKEAPKTVPYKRLQKVVAERNESRERLAELEAAAEKSNLELVELKAFRDALSDRYSRFRNPAAQLAQDADFMSALEEMAKQDREIHGFYRKVVQFMETGEKPKAASEKIEAKPDPRIEKMVEREARREIADTLEPLKLQPKYQKLITNYVMSNAKDMTDLDSTKVKKLTKEFLTEHEFKLADIQAKKPEGSAAKDKPNTGKPANSSPTRVEGDKPADPAKFKSREEYLDHRRGVLDKLIADLSA